MKLGYFSKPGRILGMSTNLNLKLASLEQPSYTFLKKAVASSDASVHPFQQQRPEVCFHLCLLLLQALFSWYGGFLSLCCWGELLSVLRDLLLSNITMSCWSRRLAFVSAGPSQASSFSRACCVIDIPTNPSFFLKHILSFCWNSVWPTHLQGFLLSPLKISGLKVDARLIKAESHDIFVNVLSGYSS